MTYAVSSSSLSSLSGGSTSSESSLKALSVFSSDKMNETAKQDLLEKTKKEHEKTAASSIPRAKRLPSPIVNKIITYLGNDETHLMSPVFWMMSGDKSDQQNFYKIMCERMFPETLQQRGGYSWKDHYNRCLAYNRGYNNARRAVKFLKDSTLFLGRVLAPIAAIQAAGYFGERYFNFNFRDSIGYGRVPISSQKSSYGDESSYYSFNAETGLVRTTCPMYVSSEYSSYRSITPYLFEPKPNVKMPEHENIDFYYSMFSDVDLIGTISKYNVALSSILLGLSSYFNEAEQETATVVKNYLKLALSTISGLALSSYLYDRPTDLKSVMVNVTLSLIPIIGLTVCSPAIKRKIVEFIHRIFPNTPIWVENVGSSLIKTLLFLLALSTKENFDYYSSVAISVLMGASLGGGITSLPFKVMFTVGLASCSGVVSMVTPLSINYKCSWRFPDYPKMTQMYSSIITGCAATGLLCSSAVTNLARRVSNSAGNFFAPIVGTAYKAAATVKIYSESCSKKVIGTACKATTTVKIYSESCYAYISKKVSRIYSWVRNR